MPAAKAGESKQALVITLVFFILLSIILGVLTFMGFSGQDQYEKDKKTAEGKAIQAEKDLKVQRTAAVLLRAYMGEAPKKDADEVNLRHTEFVATHANDQNADKDGSMTLLKKLEQQYPWDAQTNLPKGSLANDAKKLNDQLKETKAEQDRLAGELKTQTEIAKKAKDTRDAFEVDYKKKLDELNANAKADQENYAKKLDVQRTDLGESGKLLSELREKIDQKEKDYAKLEMTKNKEIKDLQRQLDKLEEKRPQVSSLTLERPRGKIVRMNRTGELPFINLGSADRVKPQLTFAIHSLGTDGRPMKDSKGSLEVVHVVNEHLSQCRITSQRDATRDPVASGDVLLNPAWDPDQKQHVAIAGIVDLTGELRKDRPAELNRALEDFKRTLEGQNVVVDAWIDFSDNSVKGKGLSRLTDFLILGDMPEEKGVVRKEDEDPKARQRDQARTEAAKLADDAKKLGVPIIKLRDFLAMTGYRLPRTQNENNLDKIHSTVPAVASPVGKPAPRTTPGDDKDK